MKTRTAVLTAVAVVAIAGATLALAGAPGRGHAGPGEPGEAMTDGPRGVLGPLGRMLDRLDLSDEQEAKIEAILDEARPGIESLRQQLRDGREAFVAAHPPETFDEKAIRAHAAEQAKITTELAVLSAKTRARVLAVLTPEQLAEFRAMHERFAEFADEFGPGMRHRGGHGQHGW
jgi:Spy/CpxP family protein refolding chaperone